MKKKHILLVLTSIFILGCTSNPKVDIVSISGRQILVNDTPFLIKGVCYNPVAIGSDKRSFENLAGDLALMVEAGVNTIRVYSPVTDESVLDEIAQAGIKVIMGIGYNQGGRNDILSGTFIDYINSYKDHAAILMWELGNEYNYHREWFEGDIRNWYTALDNAAELIHNNDPSHPVTTAHGELPDSLALALCQHIDVWGMNVYRWDKPGSIFDQWKAISSKPMYLSEAGADSYMTRDRDEYEAGPNEKAQADATRNILKEVFLSSEICSGVTLFAFVDEWWKAGGNDTQDPGGRAPNSSGVPYDGTPNEEYWGIVDIDRNPKDAYNVVKEAYLNLK